MEPALLDLERTLTATLHLMAKTLSTQQAAEQTGLTAHTLRYYERIDLIGPVERDDAGRRLYTDDDLGWIELLMRLRATGMSIQQMKQYANLQKGGDPTGVQRQEILEEHEQLMLAKLAELNACLEVVRYKIDNYKQIKAEGP